MNDILLISLGISIFVNMALLNNLRTWKPKRGRNGRFVKKVANHD